MRDGTVARLVITNPHPETREIRLRFLSRAHGPQARDEMVQLQPGENRLL